MPIRRLDDAELARRIGPAEEEPSYVRHDSCSDDEIMENYKLRIPPKFCKPLKNLQLVEGNKAYLECTVSPQNDPTMVIEWFKDDTPILQGSRIKVALYEFGFCVLEFEDVWSRDAGVYSCRATNCYGSDQISCTIRTAKVADELHQPKFCKLLKDLQLIEGNKAYLDCIVSPQNDPTMVIEWFKDDTPILQGSRIKVASNEFGFCVLEFEDVWSRDAGVYACRATNSYGSDQISCTIGVYRTAELVRESQLPEEMRAGYEHLNYIESLKGTNNDIFDPDEDPEPPIIVQPPEPVEVMEGQGARFICRVHGSPQPKLHWYKNDEILTESRRVNVWFDGIHHLEFPRVRFYDQGKITVIARNASGEDRHDTELIVLEKPNATANLKHVQRSFTDSEVKKMKSGRASTDEETPELKEAFRKAKNQRPLQTKLNHLDAAPLKMEFKSKDEQNEIGSRMREVRKLDPMGQQVSLMPDYSGQTPVDPNTGMTLDPSQVGADGSAPVIGPDGQPIPGSQASTPGTRSNRSVSAGPPVPDGTKPQFIQQFYDVSCLEGDSATFRCRVTGSEPMSVRWFKENMEIRHNSPGYQIHSEGGMLTLYIKKVSVSFAGKFMCALKNKFGDASIYAKLSVERRGGAASSQKPPQPPNFASHLPQPGTKVNPQLPSSSNAPSSQPQQQQQQPQQQQQQQQHQEPPASQPIKSETQIPINPKGSAGQQPGSQQPSYGQQTPQGSIPPQGQNAPQSNPYPPPPQGQQPQGMGQQPPNQFQQPLANQNQAPNSNPSNQPTFNNAPPQQGYPNNQAGPQNAYPQNKQPQNVPSNQQNYPGNQPNNPNNQPYNPSNQQNAPGSQQGYPQSQPNQGYPPNQPNQGYPPNQPKQGLPPNQPHQGYPTNQPNQGYPQNQPNQGPNQPNQGYPQNQPNQGPNQPNQGYPPNQPNQGYPQNQPSQGPNQPNQGYPPNQPNQGYPPNQPNQGYPQNQPNQGPNQPNQGYPPNQPNYGAPQGQPNYGGPQGAHQNAMPKQGPAAPNYQQPNYGGPQQQQGPAGPIAPSLPQYHQPGGGPQGNKAPGAGAAGGAGGSNAVPPAFLKPLKDMTLKVGEFLILEVEVVGNPAPKVTFFHNSTQLKPGSKYKIEGTGRRCRLVVANAKVSDSGMYECRLGSTAGIDTSQAMVTVQSPQQAQKTQQPQNFPQQGQMYNAPQNNQQGQMPQGMPAQGYPSQQNPQQPNYGQPPMQPQQGVFNNQGNMGAAPMGNQNMQGPPGQNYQMPPQPQQQQQPPQAYNYGAPNQQQQPQQQNFNPPPQNNQMYGQNPNQNFPQQQNFNQPPPQQQQFMPNQNQNQQPMNNQAQQPMGGPQMQPPAANQNALFVQMPLNDMTVVEGQPATLTCQIVGCTSPVKWMKNGVFLQSTNRIMAHNGPDGVYNLTLRTPSPQDSGFYSCVAVNSSPPVSTACNVTVMSMANNNNNNPNMQQQQQQQQYYGMNL
ncbi:uncharacterized protein LOC142337506 isoform X2 [Convolutriloba macropyga]|uniref:uncharacterized protein LOC142337506 isoform X2 n=1 Tax=Convolutriloba macropyga TaxID=536237 RepID=UPI003F52536E